MQQPPIRNASIVAAFVFSHSGEFGAVSLDVRILGRGHNLDLTRSYRSSLADSIGALGRGWSCNLARRVERDGNNVLYRDGTGCVHRFAHKKGDQYTSPPDLYAVLRESGRELVLEQRFGASALSVNLSAQKDFQIFTSPDGVFQFKYWHRLIRCTLNQENNGSPVDQLAIPVRPRHFVKGFALSGSSGKERTCEALVINVFASLIGTAKFRFSPPSR